ncbi:MAG: ECF RNA polymerase sigma factor SigW [Phycisphaerae bacterium]|nr:MAG: ECF RNA polymerase sigma factor SigW [Phycisphaerae bacterium]
MASMTRAREQQLVAAAAAGDRDASETLIRQHQQSVYAYIHRLSGKPDLAEDVVQEAFIRALTNLDRFDAQYRFSTWLFTIARRVFFNIIERRRPTLDNERVGVASGRQDPIGTSAEDEETRAASRDTVQRALLCVSIEQREVLVLFHQHEWPIWLIATHLGKPEGTIKSHLHRGRIRLREALERDARPRGEVEVRAMSRKEGSR